MLELSEGYKMINGHENDMIDYTFKNQNEIMKTSLLADIGFTVLGIICAIFATNSNANGDLSR